jgi:hypothetical protein
MTGGLDLKAVLPIDCEDDRTRRAVAFTAACGDGAEGTV